MSMDESKAPGSIVGAASEPSEIMKVLKDDDKRLQWIRRTMGEEVYQEALKLRLLISKGRRKRQEPSS